MASKRVKVTIDAEGFTAALSRVNASVAKMQVDLKRRADNWHRLDAIDRSESAPHRWPGDDS